MILKLTLETNLHGVDITVDFYKELEELREMNSAPLVPIH